uniref:HAT C-terminal dimerisation domain-containing protein n=1 Tax=Zea mays TaxID=4577 RepID=B6SLC5_MAIZE|nr:hypothetical protein [Zea mays]
MERVLACYGSCPAVAAAAGTPAAQLSGRSHRPFPEEQTVQPKMAGGRVLDPFCTRLDPAMVEALVCTKDWIAGARKGYIVVPYIYLQFN